MNAIDEILQEYRRMRDYGLDVKEALHALKIYVETLDLDSRQLLAQRLRAHENGIQVEPENQNYQQYIAKDPTETVWVECANCQRKNRAVEVFCFKCGELLLPIHAQFDTKHFKQATNDLFDSRHFGQDSLLILSAADLDFEVRPQLENREIIVGRGWESQNLSLDIDLHEAKALALGVSRLHLGIKFDENSEMLQIRDLGSANGTFLNGQRLHSSERLTLRSDDELRLGRLVLKVRFLHPGEEL